MMGPLAGAFTGVIGCVTGMLLGGETTGLAGILDTGDTTGCATGCAAGCATGAGTTGVGRATGMGMGVAAADPYMWPRALTADKH